ncbi:hypothetical protein ACJMK2_005021 [Sinanodonta woodiana]|uniref:IRS-type PTB domain-containing protein n=1 Tax=Sinanodonta woodiana TaxID=1069815 RepID=A0ABD3VNS5_SINWO
MNKDLSADSKLKTYRILGSSYQHMEENIRQRRHHAGFVKVSHSECGAGMGEKQWQKYHVIENDKSDKYNVSYTLSDEKQHNVDERRTSEDSLYVIMSSCEQAMQSSVHGHLASRTYSTGLENDNVVQRHMQDNRDEERDHRLKGKEEYIGKYTPYLDTQTQKGLARELDVEHNSYSKAFIKLPDLSIREDWRKGHHNVHNKRGHLNRRNQRPNSITERRILNPQTLSVGKPVRDYLHISNNKWVALPPPPPSPGRIVGDFVSSPVPKLQNSTALDSSLFTAIDKVHISRHTDMTDESLWSEDDSSGIEKETANKITTITVQSGYMKGKFPFSSTGSATDAKINKEPPGCDTDPVLTCDKKEHEDLHLYTQLQHGSSFDVTLITTDVSSKCDFIEHQDYTLTVDTTKLYLSDKRTQVILCDWPYTAIRRISADHSKHLFQFEAGRKCSSGPGILYFYAAESRILYNSIMQVMTGAHKRRCKRVQ